MYNNSQANLSREGKRRFSSMCNHLSSWKWVFCYSQLLELFSLYPAFCWKQAVSKKTLYLLVVCLWQNSSGIGILWKKVVFLLEKIVKIIFSLLPLTFPMCLVELPPWEISKNNCFKTVLSATPLSENPDSFGKTCTKWNWSWNLWNTKCWS